MVARKGSMRHQRSSSPTARNQSFRTKVRQSPLRLPLNFVDDNATFVALVFSALLLVGSIAMIRKTRIRVVLDDPFAYLP